MKANMSKRKRIDEPSARASIGALRAPCDRQGVQSDEYDKNADDKENLDTTTQTMDTIQSPTLLLRIVLTAPLPALV
jgi:hypothetical protein